ncbi:hypothetical protein [uncultured Aliiroseovarius sp.]|uniref:hypothetical protein n=1 Tax=uncultured Aliiroseovarius sp. TaxID=1658783 RepID=UPI00261223F8|nr:hypothetical protein [uncultured Aliiroseovarius sp.]
MKNLVAPLFGLMLAASAFPAFAETYDCSVDEAQSGNNKGIPPHIIVTHKDGKATVIDGLIQTIVGKPIPAKIAVNNSKRITFSWTMSQVKGETGNGGPKRNGNLVYRLTYQKGSGKTTVSMKPVGYANTFRAKGGCVVTP